jgi:hypothetical protein
MRRREFITLLGGAAAWSLAARAQQSDKVRRIGVLMGGSGRDPIEQARLAAFLDGLQQLGWTDGRNVRIDTRWPAGDADRRTYAADLVGLAPDVILASASASVAALQQASRSAPIVFASVKPTSRNGPSALETTKPEGCEQIELSLACGWWPILANVRGTRGPGGRSRGLSSHREALKKSPVEAGLEVITQKAGGYNPARSI